MGERMDRYNMHKDLFGYNGWDKFKFRFGDFCESRAGAWYNYQRSIHGGSIWSTIKLSISWLFIGIYDKLAKLCD